MIRPCRKCGSIDRRKNGRCRPCDIISSKRWKQKNKERVGAYNKDRYKEEYRQRIIDRAKEHKRNNPAYHHNKRAKLLGISGIFSNDEWKVLLENSGNICLRCGASGNDTLLTVDHIVPYSKGGTNYIDNIQPLCKSCNAQKGREIHDYRQNINKRIIQLSFV